MMTRYLPNNVGGKDFPDGSDVPFAIGFVVALDARDIRVISSCSPAHLYLTEARTVPPATTPKQAAEPPMIMLRRVKRNELRLLRLCLGCCLLACVLLMDLEPHYLAR